MPDLLVHVEGIGSREVIATDATYQSESAHYGSYPKPDGGDDNTYTLRDLSTFSVTQIASIAQGNIAYRYAFLNLTPFAFSR